MADNAYLLEMTKATADNREAAEVVHGAHESQSTEVETNKEGRPIDLKFNFDSPDCTTHYGLRGRATNIFPVESVALSQLAKKCLGRNNTNWLPNSIG
ncbi:hypothetical protein AZE42_12712 [Rhizopogon vesiculosus]|uniref:Uncharacterized protein n=1 Tax=Rhizopogon vesiculosus TaxID=180088 RepID=A0A1J8QAE1_9AGAM|nr:hypothetical protein AZE42_12712 [Rhizopogon vesiculosus]